MTEKIHATPPSITVYVPLTEEDCFNISNGKIKVRKFKQTLKILELPDFEYINEILNDPSDPLEQRRRVIEYLNNF